MSLNLVPPRRCRICGTKLHNRQAFFCSLECSRKNFGRLRPTVGPDVEEELIARYYAGIPVAEVARGLPRGSMSTLFNVLRRRGLPFRGRDRLKRT